jgi:hypothetical protein
VRDPAKQARLREAIASDLLYAQREAAKRVRKFVAGEAEDSALPWNEVHGATRGALALAQATLAAERAKTMSQTPQRLGVVVVHARLEDTPQNRLSWEQDAAKLNDARAIEAVVVAKEPKDAA